MLLLVPSFSLVNFCVYALQLHNRSIVSSPLTLSHDVNNATVMDEIWDVISNTEVLEVNQAYVGNSGGVFDQSEDVVFLSDATIESDLLLEAISTPAHQSLYKPIGGGRTAVLVSLAQLIACLSGGRCTFLAVAFLPTD